MEALQNAIESYFRNRAGKFNLDPGTLRVRYILNWGGFVNSSFEVTDERTRFHLKITDKPEDVLRLQKWFSLRSILEDRYHAPQAIEWIDLTGTGFSGVLSEFFVGEPLDLMASQEFARQIIKVLDSLHHDRTLAEKLRQFGPPATYGESFKQTYIERFTADLLIVRRSPPGFVSPQLLEWMERETTALATATESPEFNVPAMEPIHGDLHENNFLVANGNWRLLDWDDVSIGDPALDYAILLWPVIRKDPAWRSRFELPGVDEYFDKRFELCLRAQLLDGVIDVLADYVDTPDVENAAQIRSAKQLEHEMALAQYRARFGSQSLT